MAEGKADTSPKIKSAGICMLIQFIMHHFAHAITYSSEIVAQYVYLKHLWLLMNALI